MAKIVHQKHCEKFTSAVKPKCASPLQTGGGAVVCTLEFPELFTMARENVYYSCTMLRAVDFNCFSKCEDNCDIWKRQASSNKFCSAADRVHTMPCRCLCKILSIPRGVGKGEKDLRRALSIQRSDSD